MHDLIEGFEEPLEYIDRYNEENNEEIDYSHTIIKDYYKELPVLKYPGIAVQEIQNSENTRYTTNEGIHVIDLTYQIDCFSRSYKKFEAKDMVVLMGTRVDDILTGKKYRLTRVGTPSLLPVLSEKNIIKYSLRYECSLDIDTHTIYKRS